MTLKEFFDKVRGRLQGKSLNTGLRLVILCLLIAIGLGVFFATKSVTHYNHTHQPYVSNEDNFKIRFPSPPQVHNIAKRSDGAGDTISGRIYDSENASKGMEYDVYVTNYSKAISKNLTQSQTETILQAYVEQTAGADSSTVSSAKFINFQGMLAAMAVLKPTNQSVKDNYMVALLHDQDLYLILSSGITESQFEDFANSFSLTD
jgi:hypothetical protein